MSTNVRAFGKFRPFTRKQKPYAPPDDWRAPSCMRKLTTGAWEKGTTLTERQKKRVRV